MVFNETVSLCVASANPFLLFISFMTVTLLNLIRKITEMFIDIRKRLINRLTYIFPIFLLV